MTDVPASPPAPKETPKTHLSEEIDSPGKLVEFCRGVKDWSLGVALNFPIFKACRAKMDQIEKLDVGHYKSADDEDATFWLKVRSATGLMFDSDFIWSDKITTSAEKRDALKKVGIGFSNKKGALAALKTFSGTRIDTEDALYGVLAGAQIGSLLAGGLVAVGRAPADIVAIRQAYFLAIPAVSLYKEGGKLSEESNWKHNLRTDAITIGTGGATAIIATTIAREAASAINPLAGFAVNAAIKVGGLILFTALTKDTFFYTDADGKNTTEQTREELQRKTSMFSTGGALVMFFYDWVNFKPQKGTLKHEPPHLSQEHGIKPLDPEVEQHIHDQISGSGAQTPVTQPDPYIHQATPHNIPEYAVSPTETEIPVHLTATEQIQVNVDASGYDMTNPTNVKVLDESARHFIHETASPEVSKLYSSPELVAGFAGNPNAPAELEALNTGIKQLMEQEQNWLARLNENRPTIIHINALPARTITIPSGQTIPEDLLKSWGAGNARVETPAGSNSPTIIHVGPTPAMDIDLSHNEPIPAEIQDLIKKGDAQVAATGPLGKLGDNIVHEDTVETLGKYDPTPSDLQFQTPPHLDDVITNTNTSALKPPELANLPEDPRQAADRIMLILERKGTSSEIEKSITVAPTSPSEIEALTRQFANANTPQIEGDPVHATTSEEIAAMYAYLWKGKDTTGLNDITVNGSVPATSITTPKVLAFIRNMDAIFGGPGVVQSNPEIDENVVDEVAKKFGIYLEPSQLRAIMIIFKNEETQKAIKNAAYADPVYGAVDAPGSNMISTNRFQELTETLLAKINKPTEVIIDLSDNDTKGKILADAIRIIQVANAKGVNGNFADLEKVQVSIYDKNGIYQYSVSAATLFETADTDFIEMLPDSAFETKESLMIALAPLKLSDQEMRLPEIVANNPSTVDLIFETWGKIKDIIFPPKVRVIPGGGNRAQEAKAA